MIYIAVTKSVIFVNNESREVVYENGTITDYYEDYPVSFETWKDNFTKEPYFMQYGGVVDIDNWKQVKKIIPPELFL